jgi:hypothetical protein
MRRDTAVACSVSRASSRLRIRTCAEWLFGGWQIGGLLSLLTGLPVSHTINVNNQNLGGAVRGDWVRNPNLPASERTIDRWFDTAFVVPSAPGAIGNAGRNLIIGPGRKNVDVMVARNFRLPLEGHQIQFRFESFNFTNTPNFGGPPPQSVSADLRRGASRRQKIRAAFSSG